MTVRERISRKLSKSVGDKHVNIVTRFGASVANGSWRQVAGIRARRFRDVGRFMVWGCLRFFCFCTLMWSGSRWFMWCSLTLTPTAVIGLYDMLSPREISSCLVRANLLAYPVPMQPPKFAVKFAIMTGARPSVAYLEPKQPP